MDASTLTFQLENLNQHENFFDQMETRKKIRAPDGI